MSNVAWQNRITRSLARRVPVVLQNEAAECGLACLAMIAAWHGHAADLRALRQRFAISLNGTSLKHLIDMAGELHLSARALRLELGELIHLRTPCVLHWELNHFVVLVAATRSEIRIVDPARGEETLPIAAVSTRFTGIALELQPTLLFERKRESPSIPLRSLMGGVPGLRRSLAHVLALAIALEVAVLITPLFLQWTIDGAVVSGDRDLLVLLALGFGLLVVIQAAIAFARSWAVLFLSARLSLQWNATVFAHLLRLPVAWFERRHMGDILSRFGSVGVLQRTLTTGFIESLIDGWLALATLALMLLYSGTLGAVVLVSMLLYALLRWAAFGPFRRATEEQIVLAAKASSVLMESVRAATTIKLFGLEDQRQARWMNATVDAANRTLATENMAALYRAAQALLSGVENVVVVYVGALAVIDNALSVGMLLAFISYKTTFTGRVAALVDKWVQIRMLKLHVERLADILLAAPEGDPPIDRPAVPGDFTLELRGVWFRYGDADPWVLRDVNIAVPAGQCLAICGGSGSGKSTLLKILLGLLPATRGEVLIGGTRIDKLGVRGYRQYVAAVLQDDHLLAGSVADNIAYFDPAADRTRIERCARMAAVHDEIVAMAMGYETLVGDMGSSLSGGQKQRVLLARALYRQPRLLFLDEATSHLDVPRERAISDAVGSLSMTRVVVAHRPQTIASADRVVVLEGGMLRPHAGFPEDPASRSLSHPAAKRDERHGPAAAGVHGLRGQG